MQFRVAQYSEASYLKRRLSAFVNTLTTINTICVSNVEFCMYPSTNMKNIKHKTLVEDGGGEGLLNVKI